MLTPDKLRGAVTAAGGAGEAELAGPVRALREAGARAELAWVKPGQLQAVRHDLQPARTFAAGTMLDQADPEDRDAFLLRGGAVNVGRLRTGAAVQSVIKQANGAGKPVAVLCHAPGGLVPGGLARGRTVISYNLRDELRNAGRHRGRSGGGVRGNLVTSRRPGDVPALTWEMLTLSAAARGA